jgi:hypothetical protein
MNPTLKQGLVPSHQLKLKNMCQKSEGMGLENFRKIIPGREKN